MNKKWKKIGCIQIIIFIYFPESEKKISRGIIDFAPINRESDCRQFCHCFRLTFKYI